MRITPDMGDEAHVLALPALWAGLLVPAVTLAFVVLASYGSWCLTREALRRHAGAARPARRARRAGTADDGGPSLSKFVAKEATDEQLREFLILRSVYQLKEADPHSWAIPRLTGRAKAALVEIQADEYGGGRPERMHSALFARSMRGLGLDDQYGAYVDLIPAVTLASVNMMSLFGLNRRLRGAIVGHLAAYEMTSSIPNKFYSRGFRRHGHGGDVTGYFDEWRATLEDPEKLARFVSFVNAPETPDPTVAFVLKGEAGAGAAGSR